MGKPHLTGSETRTWLESHAPSVADFSRLTEGEESQAFRFTQYGEPFVLRINRDLEGFRKDRFASRCFSGPVLPIPEVIDLGWLDERHAYCISRLLPGRTLQDLAEHEIEPTLEPTAQVLATIAGVDLEDTISWGWFDAEGVGTSPTWQDYLLDIPDVSPAPDASGLDRAFIDRVFDELRWLAPLCHSPRRLVHGDFGSNNVLTDGHAITGVIDWDMAVYGDPLYDIANVMFWRSWLPCMDHLAAYVERTLPHSIEIDRRLHCYQLRIGLVEVLGLASSQDTDFARWVTSRLASIVAE